MLQQMVLFKCSLCSNSLARKALRLLEDFPVEFANAVLTDLKNLVSVKKIQKHKTVKNLRQVGRVLWDSDASDYEQNKTMSRRTAGRRRLAAEGAVLMTVGNHGRSDDRSCECQPCNTCCLPSRLIHRTLVIDRLQLRVSNKCCLSFCSFSMPTASDTAR